MKNELFVPVIALALFHRCLCVLVAYVMLISPVGFESLAQAATFYSQLETTDWASGDRTIEYTYDDNGSVVEKVTENSTSQAVLETITYDYNLQNRLVSVSDGTTTVTYKYNPDGIRVQADDGTTVTDYLIDAYNHTGYAQVLEEWSGGTHPDITYTIGDDVISQYNSTDGTECLLYDGHGSTRQLIDSSEDITDAYSYDAYGVMLGGNPGTPQNPGSPATNLLYAGEQFDTHVQMYYNRARYYDQNTGRFNRTDPFAGSPSDPQSLHKYLYAHCNPINQIDPSGRLTGTLTETTITISIQEIVISAYVTYMFYNVLSDLDQTLNRRAMEQEVQLFIQTAPEPFTQADFESLENRIKARTRDKDKKKLYLHYSFGDNKIKTSLLTQGLWSAVQWPPYGSFATRDVYPTGWLAKWFLALKHIDPPDGIYIVLPRKGFSPTSEGRVKGDFDDANVWMGGEGYQYTFGKGSGGAGTVFGPKYLPRGSFGEWE